MELHKFIEPTKKHEGEMVEVRDSESEVWVLRKLLAALPASQTHRFVCETGSNKHSSTHWRYARISVPKTYKELQAESGLKVGDWVKITRSFSSGEGGFDRAFTWHRHMEKGIGGVYQIAYKQDNCISIILDGHSTAFAFPYFVLEKVEKPQSPEEEVVYIPGPIDHWIYKGHAYRLANNNDCGRPIIHYCDSVPDGIRKNRSAMMIGYKGHGHNYPFQISASESWGCALVQDDSLLKPAPKEEYAPYTYEDIGSIMGKKFRVVNERGIAYDVKVELASVHIKSGLMIDNCQAVWLVKNATHLDENGKDTGIPFGKKVVK